VSGSVLLALTLSLALPFAAAGQTRTQDAQRRRDQIQLMEGVLAQAVRLGAEQVGRRMQAVDPSMSVLIGQARARGFVLEGYGVFFDVEIPAMRQSVLWSMRNGQRESQTASALDILRRYFESMPELPSKQAPSKQEVQQAFKAVTQQLGPVQAQKNPALETLAQPPPPGTVVAANTDPMEDPNAQYTESVKNALIDAMLDYSLPMDLSPDEWLTVAARDNEGPLAPNVIDDTVTIVLRVRGSDLAAFAADRSRRSEFRSKVEVRVF
jgi:hypothetical protein